MDFRSALATCATRPDSDWPRAVSLSSASGSPSTANTALRMAAPARSGSGQAASGCIEPRDTPATKSRISELWAPEV